MTEIRKIAAIVTADVVGFSRLAAADEDRTLARARALRNDRIDPTIAAHKGRVVKLTGDGSSPNFAAWSVRCAIEVQNAMPKSDAGVPEHRRVVFASIFFPSGSFSF
jgi:adenylate cyclase